MVQIEKYGWQRDRLDSRDRIFNLEERVLAEDGLRPTNDLTSEMPSIWNQLQIGTCVAHATPSLLEHQQMRQGEPEGKFTPSRLFVYFEGRKKAGLSTDQDTGMQIRDGIKVLVEDGAPPESDWPYSDANPGPFQEQPPQSAYDAAKKFEATVYQRIVLGGPGAPMRTAISNHQPIAFGFSVPDYFEDPSWDVTNVPLRLPGANPNIIGGHAVVVVGYDFSLTRFRVPVFRIRNSWGADWGDKGHFWMPSQWFDPWRNLSDDLWVVKKVS